MIITFRNLDIKGLEKHIRGLFFLSKWLCWVRLSDICYCFDINIENFEGFEICTNEHSEFDVNQIQLPRLEDNIRNTPC